MELTGGGWCYSWFDFGVTGGVVLVILIETFWPSVITSHWPVVLWWSRIEPVRGFREI